MTKKAEKIARRLIEQQIRLYDGTRYALMLNAMLKKGVPMDDILQYAEIDFEEED